MHHRHITTALAVAALAVGAGGLIACGDDDSNAGGTSAATVQAGKANGTDLAFATEMVAHHQMAVDMAQMAQERATHAQVKTLAKAIVAAQTAEIAQLEKAQARMTDDGVTAKDLGMSREDMGMEGDMPMLEKSSAFDRTFIDMMIPHHEGAIRMARIELADGQDPEMRALAKDIVAAQSKEIDEMTMWRKDWYGDTTQSDDAHGDDGMTDHGSMHGN